MVTPAKTTRATNFEWRLALKCTLGFIALNLVYRSINAALTDGLGIMLDPSIPWSVGLAVALSFGLCAILGTVAQRGLAIGLASAVVFALPTSTAFAAGDLTLQLYFADEVDRSIGDRLLGIVANNTSRFYFFYFGLGAFFVGMSSARHLQAAERRASEFERQAYSAQLRALRYQVNPHFLFNTLNSLSSLIMSRRLDQAETMILNLSAFFRSALAIDPTEDVPLLEEIRLQRLYLDIEHARFPGRLHVNVTVPPLLEAARVPALLLQPLIENAIKYGVSRTPERVTIDIIAEHLGEDSMRLIVEDSGSVAAGSDLPHYGTGVGLSNVRERLQARFGAAASCESGARSGGGYRVALTLPVERA